MVSFYVFRFEFSVKERSAWGYFCVESILENKTWTHYFVWIGEVEIREACKQISANNWYHFTIVINELPHSNIPTINPLIILNKILPANHKTPTISSIPQHLPLPSSTPYILTFLIKNCLFFKLSKGSVDNYIFEIVIYLLIEIDFTPCLLKSEDTSERRKTSSLKEDTLPKNFRSANSENNSCKDTSLISTLISTELNNNETGLTSPKGTHSHTQRIQLRRHFERCRLRILHRECRDVLENLRQQGHGMVASFHCPPHLSTSLTNVTPPRFSLLQKHNKKLFDMCNLGE